MGTVNGLRTLEIVYWRRGRYDENPSRSVFLGRRAGYFRATSSCTSGAVGSSRSRWPATAHGGKWASLQSLMWMDCDQELRGDPTTGSFLNCVPGVRVTPAVADRFLLRGAARRDRRPTPRGCPRGGRCPVLRGAPARRPQAQEQGQPAHGAATARDHRSGPADVLPFKSDAHYYSNRVNPWLREVAKITDPRLSFHSVRHAVKDRVRAARVPEPISRALMGHGSTGVADSYGLGCPMSVLAEEMANVRY